MCVCIAWEKTNKNLCFLNRWCWLPLPLRAARSIPNSNSMVFGTNRNFLCFTDSVTVLSLSDPNCPRFVIVHRSIYRYKSVVERLRRYCVRNIHVIMYFLFTNSHKQNRVSHANGKTLKFSTRTCFEPGNVVATSTSAVT